MKNEAFRTVRFFLERWILRGLPHQLLLMATLVALVALTGGLAAWALTPAFSNPGEAIWWAFLRLTDPGYLGDDAGLTLRVISTAVTVLGYVLFMGSLIAIMTQWLARTLRELESGLTPIRMRGHIVILGWSNRTPEIVRTVLRARGRLARFLEQRHAGRLRIVILCDEVGAERRLELRDALGGLWNESQIYLRTGSALQPDHLRRLDLGRASAIILPGAEFDLGHADAADTRVVKSLMTVDGVLRASGAEARPNLVAEILDPLRAPLAEGVHPSGIEVVAGASVIARMISQSVRHRGLARVLIDMLSHHQGDSIHVRHLPQLEGHAPHALQEAFPRAIVLGFVRGDATDLDARTREVLRRDDLLVLLAPSFDDCAPTGPLTTAVLEPRERTRAASQGARRILVLGWSHKLGALAVELDQSGSLIEHFELLVMSRVGVEERERWLERVDFSRERVRVAHVEGDYSIERDLLSVDPGSFDDVVFLASDVVATTEESDARTILGNALLRIVVTDQRRMPEVLIELLDPDNAHLVREHAGAHLVTPRTLSYLLAHVALRPELNSVFDELFRAGGPELSLCAASELELPAGAVPFLDIQRAAQARGMVALGFLDSTGRSHLNPDRAQPLTLDAGERVVVLTPA